MSLLIDLAWSLAILLALAAWGRAAMRLLRRNTVSPLQSWLEAPAWGIASASLIGGLLNLARLSARPELIAFIAAGACGCLIECASLLPRLRRDWPTSPLRRDPIFLALSLLFAALLAFRLLYSLSATFNPTNATYKDFPLNPGDDRHSYLVEPTRLLQTGSLGEDPFNSRTLMSALGTQHFLNASALALLPEYRLHVLDSGIALIALAFAAAGFALSLQLPPRLVAAILLAPLLVPFANINLSANVTAAAALAALLSLAADPLPTRPYILRWSLQFGFLLASAFSLKTTIIFPAAIFALTAFVLRAATAPRHRLVILLSGPLALAAAFIALSPWMLWQFHSGGSLLYPILGQGFHRFASSPFPPLPTLPAPAAAALAHALPFVLLILLAAILLFAFPKTRRAVPLPAWSAILALLVAWAASWPVFAWQLQMIDLQRYLLPIYAVALIALVALLWKISALFKPLLPISLVALLLFTAGDWSILYFDLIPADFPRHLADPNPAPARAAQSQLRQLQSLVPPGQPILAYLENPSDLDFTRNPIFVADWPSETSPPPGMPITRGPAALRSYLDSVGIHYILTTYLAHSTFFNNDPTAFLTPDNGDIVRRQSANSFLFHKLLAQLAPSTTLHRTPQADLLQLHP